MNEDEKCDEGKTEKSYTNPWSRNLSEFYHISSPVDQGRIIALEFPKNTHVKKKVKALKRLIRINSKIEKQFFQELLALKEKYQKLLTPLYEQRAKIIKGELIPHELEDDTADIPEDFEDRGIPRFWCTCLSHEPFFLNLCDVPVLSYLKDIRLRWTSDGYMISFDFAPNKYFSNSTLDVTVTTEYKMSSDRCGSLVVTGYQGTEIDWKDGIDVTKWFELKDFECPSLFASLFKHRNIVRYSHGIYYTLYIIKDQIIPRAVLYYIGPRRRPWEFSLDSDGTYYIDYRLQ